MEGSFMQDDQLIKLGEEVRKLGASTAFNELLDQISKTQHEIIENSEVEAIETRQAAYHMIRAIRAIKTQVSVVLNRAERAKTRKRPS